MTDQNLRDARLKIPYTYSLVAAAGRYPGNVPGAVEILGGGLIAPEVILGAVKDKSRHEEDCHKSHQKNR